MRWRPRLATTQTALARLLLVSLLALVIFLIGVAAVVSVAYSSPACLTQSEARRAFPGEYLSYRVRNGSRCWSAPKDERDAKPVRQAKAVVVEPPAPVPEPVAEPEPLQPPPPPRWIIKPTEWSRALWYPPGWPAEGQTNEGLTDGK